MIKSYDEAEKIYIRRNSKKSDLEEQYKRELARYNRANSFVRFILGKPVKPVAKKQEKVEFPVVGQKYAIKYDDIMGPVIDATYDDGLIYYRPQYNERQFFDPTHLKVGNISSLWTVVEYIGNNQFVDLVTGKTFGLPIEATSILEDARQETEEKTKEIKQALLETPLCIRCSKALSIDHGEGYGPDVEIYYEPVSGLIPLLQEVTDDVKASIMEKTMPVKDKILSELTSLEDQSRDNIEEYYRSIEKALREEAEEKSRKEAEAAAQAEAERQAAEATAQAEEERQAEMQRLKALKQSLITEFDQKFGDELDSDEKKK